MNKLLSAGLLFLVLCFLAVVPVEAMGGPAPEKEAAAGASPVVSGVFVIDNFESGNLKSPQEWWTFDLKEIMVAPNNALTEGDAEVSGSVGNYSLQLKGPSKNWYAGGAGTYIAKENMDLSKYNALQLDIYGNGEGSGRLKIELFDDDNANWQAEQNPAKNYAPTYDDKLVYDVNVDWSGWQRIVIPFDDFVDDNPGVGDDVWNPQQKDGSGGLLQLQLICLGPTETGVVNFNLDNISLTTSEK